MKFIKWFKEEIMNSAILDANIFELIDSLDMPSFLLERNLSPLYMNKKACSFYSLSSSYDFNLDKLLVPHNNISLTELSNKALHKPHILFDATVYKKAKIKNNVCIITKMQLDNKVYFFLGLLDDDFFESYKELQSRRNYYESEYQRALLKQIKLLQDDLSHIEIKDNLFVDSFFLPLDTVSGDMYETIDLGNGEYLFYIIDAMGKGISASFTAMQSSACIKKSSSRNISFKELVEIFLDFSHTILLDDEILSIILIHFTPIEEKIEVANFGMPSLLMQQNQTIHNFYSTNPPISQYSKTVNIDNISTKGLDKLMLYSDGVNELITKSNELYDDYLEDDFRRSNTLKEFFTYRDGRIIENRDDVSAIYLRFFKDSNLIKQHFSSKSSIDEIGFCSKEIKQFLFKIGVHENILMEISFLLNELMLNSLEHGNYGISSKLKEKLISNKNYKKYLSQMSKENIDKKIDVYISKYFIENTILLKISICDEGSGFDVSKYFKNLAVMGNKNLNGRGIVMVEEFTDGIYYNKLGNVVTIVKTIYKG